MKKIIITFLISVFLLFGVNDLTVYAQTVACSRADITNFTYDVQPVNPGDPLTLSLQTSSKLYNQTLAITIINETTNKSLGLSQIPIDSAGRARPTFNVSDRGNYRITISGTGGTICFDQTYGFSPTSTNSGNSGVGTSSGITCNGNGIDTAIGCIPFGDQNALIGFFLKWGVGIGGGIAFLLILIAGFQIMTSRGDPKKLQAGQELMTSAISGLLLLIFSLVILRIIGLDVLGIKFFG